MLLSVRPGFNLGRAFFARSMAAFSHPRGQHLVQELSQPAVRRGVLVPRMPILPDLKCIHKNWRPHGPESVDLGEPTNHASRSGKNKVRLEARCQRLVFMQVAGVQGRIAGPTLHRKAAGTDNTVTAVGLDMIMSGYRVETGTAERLHACWEDRILPNSP